MAVRGLNTDLEGSLPIKLLPNYHRYCTDLYTCVLELSIHVCSYDNDHGQATPP